MGRKKDTEEQPRRRKKKKSKFGYYLYAVMILVLTIANITIATLLLTYVQKIKVTGIQYCTNSQITTFIKEDPLTANSIYSVVKYKLGSKKIPNYLTDMKVGFDMPWGLHVKVTEKQIAAGISVDNVYVYFAEDGTVMTKRTEPLENVYVIEGVEVKRADMYSPLELKNSKLLSYIVSISKELKKIELQPDSIAWEDDSMNLYFDGVCAKLGKLNYGEKVIQIPPALENLVGQEGVLNLEHFDGTDSTFSFKKKSEI